MCALKGGLWLTLLWPAFAFGLVSLSYFIGTSILFGKRKNGSRHPLATLLLGPYLAFAWAVWTLQILLSREPAWQTVGDSLIVARRLRAHELPENVESICDLTSELVDPQVIRRHAGYVCCPTLDANGLPPDELVALIKTLKLAQNGRLLIHCANGHGRTGMVAAAWLVATGRAESADEALSLLRAVRPGIELRDRQRHAVESATGRLRHSSS